MRTRLRTLLLLASVALVGLSLLAVLAHRYRGMTELRSVEDVTPLPPPAGPGAAPASPASEPPREPKPPVLPEKATEPPRGIESGAERAGGPTARSQPPLESAQPDPSPQPGEGPAVSADERKVEAEARGFLATRRMVVAYIREHQSAFERFLDPETGGLRHEMPRGTFEDMHRLGLVLSVKKYDVAKQHDMSLDDYVRWRSAFLAWKARGEASSPEGRWFAAHPEAAEGLELGGLELFDAATDANVRGSSGE